MSALVAGNTPFGINRTIFQLIGANMNTTADQPFLAQFPFSTWILQQIIVTQASGSLSGALGGIYLSAGKTTPIVASTQAYVAITGATDVLILTPNAAAGKLLSSQTLFLSLTTALGSAATANIYVMAIAG